MPFQPDRRRFPFPFVLLLTLGAAFAGAVILPDMSPADASPAVTAATPSAGTVDQIPDLRERRDQIHLREAESKAALARAWTQRPSLRTANQNDWDVHHYDLDLNVDPSTHVLSGTVTTAAEVVAATLTQMQFQLTGLTVSAATAGGSSTTWSRTSTILTVDLDRTYTTGETVTVAVTYSGNPAGEAFGWSSFGGSDMIWTLSEPFGARSWWPCKDLNIDKADSVDIRVTVPDPLIVASNGVLQSTTPSGGWTTYHWKTTYPISTYLVSMAIHPYTVFSHTYTPMAGGSMPVDYYVYPSHYSAVQATYALTVPMIGAFAGGYGEYPFVDEKYGHAEFVWGGGMEHQTLTSLGGYSEDLISHELSHQWWGDHITCQDFHHIWLNEGFATFSEAYWKEQTEGIDTYHLYMDAAAYYGSGTIYVEYPAIEDIFDTNLSYNKASWVPHMLRHVVGDTDFFAGLAAYRAAYGMGTATTEQFRDVMANVSGKNLDAFFQQWIYGEYFPVYRPSWTESSPGTIDLTIEQAQTNTGLFTMPIDVRVTTSGGTFDFTVDNSLATQDYQLSVTGDVQSVEIDPDHWILRQVETTVANPTFGSGVLVVNGVDWGTYTSEIRTAYADSVFWADLPFTFWDNFPEPSGGYPANLPAPIGHGSVPADLLGKFSAVVWVGNNYNGDLPKWVETPIESYLNAGGNVLLLSRMGNDFLSGSLASYLGITITNTSVTPANMNAVHPAFQNISFTGTQSYTDLFSTSVGPNSTLLFQSQTGLGPFYGSGVIAEPPGGGTARPDGGKFAHIAGRPYRMNHANLRANVETILKDFFGEPYTSVIGVPLAGAKRSPIALEPGAPNPFRAATRIAFRLPAARSADVTIYDVTGRLVRTLLNGPQPAGYGEVTWNGRDAAGEIAASGVYYVRLRSGGEERTRPVVHLR